MDNLGSNRVSLGEQNVKLVSTNMISQKTIWIDKDAFYPLVAVPLALFFLFVIGVTGRLSSAREAMFLLLLFVVVVLLFIASSVNRPLRIDKRGFRIGKKWSLFSVLVPFEEIQRMSIKFGIIGKYNETLLVTDKAGNEYVNVIYGVNSFKKALLSLRMRVPSISDESWYRHLPKKLR